MKKLKDKYGQPYLTWAVAYALVNSLNEQQRKETTIADVDIAQRMMISGGEYFANVMSDAKSEGRAILRAIAKGETPPEHPKANKWLRDHDVLDESNQFVIPIVERWVREKLEEEWCLNPSAVNCQTYETAKYAKYAKKNSKPMQ